MAFILDLLAGDAIQPQFQKLLSLVLRPDVSDVVANGSSEWWLDSGQGLVQLAGFQLDSQTFEELVRLLVALGDRHVDQVTPIADVAISSVQLPILERYGISRLRLHAVVVSAVSDLTLLSIRVHRVGGFDLADLLAGGMITQSQASILSNLSKKRANLLISGPSGSGKSTLLRALIAHTPNLRTVVVEDTAELVPAAGHVVGLQVRQPNIEGAGAIKLQTLAIQALRMRPDRLVIGEVRGDEAAVLLQAMNTGHRGSAATLHANSIGAVLPRLQALLAPSGFSAATVVQATRTAIDFVIQLDRSPNRCVVEIAPWSRVEELHQQC